MKRISEAEIRKLKEIKIVFIKKRKEVEFNAYTIPDEGFLKWFLNRMGRVDSTNRLRFRLALIGLLGKIKSESGRVMAQRKKKS